jgi:hypothetical protein
MVLGRRPVLLVLLVVALAGCAASANPEAGTAVVEGGQPAGFWLGLWHGLIAPVTFVVSLFKDGIGIYEVHNSGGLYDFGYVLGLGMLVGGSNARR